MAANLAPAYCGIGITVEYWSSDTGQVCPCGPLLQPSTHNTLQLDIGAGVGNKTILCLWVSIKNGGEGWPSLDG